MSGAVSQTGPGATGFRPDERFAREQDEADPLRSFRERFAIPRAASGEPAVYFCGNSLGLQPAGARAIVEQELDDWANLAVEGHFHARTPWYSYHEAFRESAERLVGARPGAGEVVMMNTLTVNLHLMMVSLFRPTADRFRVLIDWPAFPSDVYAVTTHLRTRGLDPEEALLVLRPREGEHVLRMEDLDAVLDAHGESIALILFAGVNFLTGQVMDMAAIAERGRARGCTVGFDLAHAVGNVPLRLHDWGADFACWCSYKYLNGGPGAVGGCFVHERHARNVDLPRYGGWWGNDPETRFRMHLQPEFVPRPDADGWQLSNPPILSLAPLRASFDLFDEAGMAALRAKSVRLTGYLRYLLERGGGGGGESGGGAGGWGGCEIITPREPDAQGCQLSILMRDRPRARFEALQSAGVVCDFREPNVIRVAPVPLYNTWHEVWRFAEGLKEGTPLP